jgi:hypothetical protein
VTRVIFLDIDGVLNSEKYALELEARHRALGHTDPARPKRETTCDCFKLYHQIDRAAVARLNRVIAEAGAKIVVSSTWRKLFDLPELHRILSEHGLVGEIVGVTPEGHKEPGLTEMYGHPDRMERGYEIDYWLRQHPEVDRFVILDDGSDMAMHGSRLVQTDCEDGLCDEHVELAIRMLLEDSASAFAHPADAQDESDRAWRPSGAGLRHLEDSAVSHVPQSTSEILDTIGRLGRQPDGQDWDQLNARRIALIDKLHSEGALSPPEWDELEKLRAWMRRELAVRHPLPFDRLEECERLAGELTRDEMEGNDG